MASTVLDVAAGGPAISTSDPVVRPSAEALFTRLTAAAGVDLVGRVIGVVVRPGGDARIAADTRELVERCVGAGASVRVSGGAIAWPSEAVNPTASPSPHAAVHRCDAVVVLGGPWVLGPTDLRRLLALMRHRWWFDGRRPADRTPGAELVAMGVRCWPQSAGGPPPTMPPPHRLPGWQAVHGVPIRGVPPGFVLPPVVGAGNDFTAIEASGLPGAVERVCLPGSPRTDAPLVVLHAPDVEVDAVLMEALADRWRADAAVVVASVEEPAGLGRNRLPFAEVDGRLIAVSRALYDRVGPLDTRCPDPRSRAVEWAFRAVEAGAYLAPAPRLAGPSPPIADPGFLTDRCPLGFRDLDAPAGATVPRVTVYIPAFDAAATLGEAIDSALGQDFVDLEVCVVDDGSTDDTPAVLARYTDEPRVRWLRQDNGGISSASNAAIALGRGPYIAQLDADDVLRPHAVRTLVEQLEAEDVALVYGSNDVIDADGRLLGPGWEWPLFSREKLMASNIVHHFRMWRRRDWNRVGRFDPSLANAEDYDFALRMSERGRVRHVTAPVYLYRRHGDSNTATQGAVMRRNHLRAMRRALTRTGLDADWFVLPDPRPQRREGVYQRRSETMQPDGYARRMDDVLEQARALLGDAPAAGPLREVADEVCAARFALCGWWAHRDLGAHFAASRPALVARLIAAQVEADRGAPSAALVHAEAALSMRPVELFAQRLAEAQKHALGQPAWTPEDEADLAERFCSAPFERLETRPDGAVKMCCNSWLNVAIGHVDDDPDAIWNSPVAQEVRRSVLEGRYTYCSRTRCPRIINKMLPRRADLTAGFAAEALTAGETELTSKPRDIKLNHDRSCNLSCPSCRRSVYTADGAEFARLTRVADEVILPLLRDARVVEITGSGDAFASRHFRYILHGINRAEYPDIEIDLFTNGLMFTESTWNQLELSGLCRRAVISTDATEEATYRALRRGGKLSKLLANFPFISQLRQRGELKRVVLVFVIQRANYAQIPDMIRLTRRFGFDETFLKVLDRWGQTELEYADRNVASPHHPLHDDLLRILRDPLLDDPVVNLGTLKPAYDRARAAQPTR